MNRTPHTGTVCLPLFERIDKNAHSIFHVIIVLGVVLAFAEPVQAVTRYVAVDGNDLAGANTCTDPEAPCLTITHAMSVAAPTGDDIQIAAGAYTEPLNIDKSLALQGAGQGVTLLQAADVAPGSPGDASERVITISGAPELEISGLTVRFGQDVNGGGILTGGTLTLTDVIFFANTAFNEGGGMYNAGGSSPTLNHVTFANNTASFGGGMWNIDGSSPTLNNVSFIDNEAAQQGGGMLNIFDSNPVLNGVTFSGNGAGDQGGGMYNFDSDPELNDVIFDDNSADQSGGGMYTTNSASPALNDVRFENNSADNGGGIYNTNSSRIALNNVRFENNNAISDGGGIYGFESFSRLINVSFDGNQAGGSGGGIYGENSPPIICLPACQVMIAVIFNNNAADFGGGMSTNAGFDPMLLNVAFNGNTASFNGGGMLNSTSSPRLFNVTFSGNAAGISLRSSTGGGGMYNDAGASPTLTNVTFSGNAAHDGGGMFNIGASPAIRNTIFWHNHDNGDGPTSGSIVNAFGADPGISYSLIQGCNPEGVWDASCGTDGGNNLADANPLFIETPDPDEAPTTAGNLRLQADSPAIDAGDSELLDTLEIDTDLDGNPRIFGDDVDLGPYEWRLLADEIFRDRFEQ